MSAHRPDSWGGVDKAKDLEIESSPAWVMYQDLVVLATSLDTTVNKEFQRK